MPHYSQEQLDEAKEFIDKLRRSNGGLTREDRKWLAQKPDILELYDNIRRQLGASTQILAEQLYQKSTRFVYELIQNAEDNKYTIATELPYLTFALQKDRIIIDSNEDGFTQVDIKAICSIGQSTKASIQGYIGEKGIGFKSVFNVAHKVHIQSGPYSFAFEYLKGDPVDRGLGMVTPISESRCELPDNVRTRTILYLHEDEDPEALCQDLLKLPNTLLLFLKKLRQLTVKFELPEKDIQSIQFSLVRPDDKDPLNKIVQIKTATTGTINSVTSKSFWVKKRRVVDLPADPARDQIHEAEVVLAFPIDEDNVPVLEDQYAFAFLPLKKTGYKFLIQSDFITKASREDKVIVDSAWNKRLLEEVVATFHSAVEGRDGFLGHAKLRYSWVRYIPTTSIADDFWGPLQGHLLEKFSTSRLFHSRDGLYWMPNQLRILQDTFLDENGAPLLADLTLGPTAYVSESYDIALDIPVLVQMKALYLGTPGFLLRLVQDLDPSRESRMRSTPPNSHWHTQVADLLIGMAQDNNTKKTIQKLNIIPLSNGTWVCPLNASIFFPASGGVDIPEDLHLNLLDRKALESPSRKKLFSEFGVTTCSPGRIFPLIKLRYTPRGGEVTVANSCQDINFIFWHHGELPADGSSIALVVMNGEGLFVSWMHNGGWIYCLHSDHAYATNKILGNSVPSELRTVNHIRYPMPEYYKSLESCGIRNNHTGIEWFRSLGIKETPQLRRRGSQGPEMSAELKYIAKNLPQFLLGVLRANWEDYNESEEWDTFFREKDVPIIASSKLMSLQTTYLPLPKLKTIAQGLELEQSFGFLQELDGIKDHDFITWGFLERFGVGVDEDVSFWLTCLSRARQIYNPSPDAVFKIYSRLQTYVNDSDVTKIKKIFEADMIFIPTSKRKWITINKCVWNAPVWFTFLPCLQRIERYERLQALFINTLEISDARFNHFLAYLVYIQKSLKFGNDKEEAKVLLIYDKLNELTEEGRKTKKTKTVRSVLENMNLLYYPPNKSWYAPSSCIWAPDEIQLPDKISIATEYKSQRIFFQNVLGIKKPDLGMHILALQQRALEKSDKKGILRELENICALNPVAAMLQDKLSKCKFLPVCGPFQAVQWMDSTGNFAVVDRKEYGDLFKDKINMLDFSLEEVHSIKPILASLELEGRYISRIVKEETRIEDGSLNDILTKDLRRKAYAICRYAAHYGCKDTISAYGLLQSLEVFTSESITKAVSIAQNKKTISIEVDTAFLHIAQNDNQLKIYVPNDQRQREVCLSRQLPIELLKHLGVPDLRRGAELGSIITATSSFTVEAILDADGIIQVPGISPPGEFNEIELSDVSPTITTPEVNADSEQVATSPESQYNVELSPEDHNVRAESIDSSLWTSARSHSSISRPPQEQLGPFKELLDAVTKQARSIHRLPAASDVLIAPISADNYIDTGLALNSSVPGQGLFRIGAAGELFMFEVLKGLGLPLFDLQNWRSTIRHLVTVHDDYKDMPGWNGSETSDIVYSDHEHKLTEFLVANNYLNHIEASNRNPRITPPTYYIEVKTTPGPLNTQFYCSQGQFDRMESMRLQANQPLNNVYLIARVFNLGASGMGFKLYVDPAELRRKGELKFTADKYVITS